jgi:hypothetical protein
MDLQSAQVVVAIAIGVLTVLGTIFGWFGKAAKWSASVFKRPKPAGLLDLPPKTLLLMPVSRYNALWWHLGTLEKQPAMQIVGDLNVTNISTFDVVVRGAKIRKHKAALSHAFVRQQGGDMYGQYPIPAGGITELRFDFFVQPPTREVGQLFKADIAIIDQFGNEHWLKDLEFRYT